jgi:hypothetical protein
MASREDPFSVPGGTAPLGPQDAPKLEAKTEKPSALVSEPGGPVQRASRADPRPRHQLRPLGEMPDSTDDDRLRIPKDEFPDQFDLQWITDSIFGQPQPHHRSRHERRGWEPVFPEDFEGRYRGRFCPIDYKGEIKVDGMVLMARPRAWSDKARLEDQRRAAEAVMIKERQLRGGEIDGVGMDGGAQHPSAIRTNRIGRSYERLRVPND